MSRYISKENRQKVKTRAKDCCEYCYSQEDFSPSSFSIEHILPVAKGGQNTLGNLAYACQGCNNTKYTNTENIDAVTGETISFFHPRKDNWKEHFKWSDNKLLIIPLTPKGRVTLNALNLNRKSVVNLRKVLILIDKHPPE